LSLESNGVDRVHSLRKILMRLRGTNFCTSLARFALSFVTHPNFPKCIQIVQTHRIKRLGSNGVDRVHSLRNPTRLHGTNFCTTLARFAPSFVRQPNGTKCTQIVRNAPKPEFSSQRGQSGVFIAKNYDATSWHDLLHQFGSFCTEFCKATKRSQMHPNRKNTPKYEFSVRWGGSGALVAKKFGPFCTECCNGTILSQMHPSSTKRFETWG
jgi:hypothetical protein